jgi:hypothetical protein
MPRSVRMRLTAWYASTLAAVLIVYAAGVYVFLQRALLSTLDQQLADDVEAAEQLFERSSTGGIAWRGPSHADEDHEEPWIEVWNQSGAELYRSAVARRVSLPSRAEGTPLTSYASLLGDDGTRLRVC